MAETPAVDDVAEVEEGADALDNDAAGGGDEGGKQGKTWYPYITKNQFDKFLARLDGKVPSEIDRDYVRAIIRTPSMIYRFLRGIEAMKLIDRDQKPTDRLHRLVDTETRSDAMREVVRDLYGDMLDEREGVSYPDIAQSSAGDIYVYYDRNRNTDAEILFARIREEDVLAGALANARASLRNVIKDRKGMQRRHS